MPSRRSVLVGLGGLVAGGGALIGTGAFTTVEAERNVNVETAGDASAFLGLEAADRSDDSTTTPGTATSGANQNEYVTVNGGQIQINLDGGATSDEGGSGLNESAITTFRELVTITNNGTQTVDSLTLDMIVDSLENTLDSSEYTGTLNAAAVESAFQFTASDGSTTVTVTDNSDILASGNLDSSLGPGQTVDFGLEINLIQDRGTGSISTLPAGSTAYTLSITAETANSQ